MIGRAPQEDRETRDRLLRAAERLFSERGFKAVTVREICLAANANVAAVNYHFGDKFGLYREVLQVAIRAMRGLTDAAREAGEGKPPEEQLRIYISLFLKLIVSSGNETAHRLLHREMNDPTEALDDIIEQGIRPRFDYLSGVIAAMTGRRRTDPRVARCLVSMMSQFMIYAQPNAAAQRLGFGRPTGTQIDDVARHIAEFSIAGIQAAARAR